MTAAQSVRPLGDIAWEIVSDWKKPYFGAIPYMKAMAELDSMSDKYGAEDASLIVSYFLANASTWRGETARRVKKELSRMLEKHRGSR